VKASLQILDELGFAACIVVAAVIALTLMLGCAVWKSVASSE
jgi:hypothetical protein